MLRTVPTLLATMLTACATPNPDASQATPTRPVHTYSIVARDAATGELGVAVQSHWFSVGPLVPWAEAGVGAIATQSFVNPAFGPEGLALLRAGKPAADVLRELVAGDAGEAVRQLAIVDAKGTAAAHTGARCIEAAGHHVGEGYSVQANMMLNDRVVPAMVRAYEAAQGALAERLLATLAAAQAAGGDIRGQQSAALLIVAPTSSGKVWEDRRVDLRVEDHPRPVAELTRLYTVHTAYEHMNAGDAALEKGDTERALAEYARAAELVPDNVEVRFWSAFTLATSGAIDEALPSFKSVFEEDANWIELLKRLPAAGLTSEDLVERVLAGASVR